jgi:hypothetical protein
MFGKSEAPAIRVENLKKKIRPAENIRSSVEKLQELGLSNLQ